VDSGGRQQSKLKYPGIEIGKKSELEIWKQGVKPGELLCMQKKWGCGLKLMNTHTQLEGDGSRILVLFLLCCLLSFSLLCFLYCLSK